MKNKFALLFSILACCSPIPAAHAETKPLKALLIAGGCCHDYKGQHKVLCDGIQARANVQVDVVWTDDGSTNPPLPIYDNPDWAKGYDVIIHDECAADRKDIETTERILEAHKTIPSVHLHCAMHSFRTGTDKWFRHLGLASNSHGPQEPIEITFVDKEHPITASLEDWTTIKEELYNNVEIFDAHALAMGKQMVNGKAVESIVAWTNEKQGARSFSTTIGHNTETVADARYLDLVTRGLLWSCDKLAPDYQQAFKGENKITFVSKEDQAAAEIKKLSEKMKDATIVTVTTSSEQSGNLTWYAIDQNEGTRWCANGASMPQWLQLEFEKPQDLEGIAITWESGNNAYQHKIEAEAVEGNRELLIDATGNEQVGNSEHALSAKAVKRLIITCTGTSRGGWSSIREITVKGPGIKSIFPKLDAENQAEAEKSIAATDYAKQGNITPKIVDLSPEKEAEILSDVKVPEGFDLTLFAPSETANYPVYVAAAPNGDVYVSSDGNGSLGRNPHRGRILRLRDADGDGRADQVTEFVKDIDSPRGLVWDHDRLYLVHPPHVSVFIDKDGDGVAEESKRLIEGIAFGFADRPADHTTNGLDMGIDGWLYVAGGDFGFMNATGTDGRKLQHRGGGVIRFRPDGSGLEIFSTGTRNILGTPISPLLEIFARDNTNDGGGWDVRFHHFTGLEDHGYPRMYKNFGDEHIAPLADYGGGSGCGSTYLSEPGFPSEWNHAPFTCDWGTGALWKHAVERKGATFIETSKPEKFIAMTRPTDATVDGLSHVYQASWKGATFDWAGPDAGYIVRVSPKGYTPEPLPDFARLSDAELVAALQSPSQVRTLEAQRTLLRRPANGETTTALYALAGDHNKTLSARVAALYAITLRDPAASLQPLAADVALQPFVLRALGDMTVDGNDLLTAGLMSEDPKVRIEALVSATRRGLVDLAPAMASRLGDSDPTVAHTAFRGLSMLGASEACFAVLDASESTSADRLGASRALMRMHKTEVVDGLIARLKNETREDVRQLLLSALCRLANIDGEWKGDSWGTRPDTRGPYYQPEPWSETPKVADALAAALNNASAEEAAFIVKEMSRNRIQSDDALAKMISLADSDPSFASAAIEQLAATETIPPAAIPMLLKAAQDSATSPATLAQSISALSKTDDTQALPAMLSALVALDSAQDAGQQQRAGAMAFLGAPKLENHHLALETYATEHPDSPAVLWTDAGLLALAARDSGSPESREMSLKAIDQAWESPQRRVNLINAAVKSRSRLLNERILASVDDADQDIATAAKAASKDLRLERRRRDRTPKISTLEPEKALAEVIAAKGDVALGEQIFTRATCFACHTVSQDEPQKGPYLGNIAQTYKRPDLAANILDPNKTIAQGFASNVVSLKDGTVVLGFVTDEAGDTVTLRDIAAKEHKFQKSDITSRTTVPTSLMPPGLMNSFTVREMASLLDYLEALSKK
ncbi:MAG: ThuA domain-containing protein [Verrucomicrobiales bacterium]